MTIARMPPASVVRVPLGNLRCARCDAAECSIYCIATMPITAFCGPHCAAAWGVPPWAGADLVTRAEWPEPASGGFPASKEA